MPSTNETAHGLNLWVEDDVPTMEDFNDDNLILESFMSTNGVSTRTFQLPVDAWEDTPYVSYPYQTVIPSAEMSDEDDAMVLFDLRSIFTAKNAGITDGIGETVDGGVKIYAAERPKAALNGVFTLMHREA